MTTQLLLHCDGYDGSQFFPDTSQFPPGKTYAAVGNSQQVDTAQSKFGGASALFNGFSDYLLTNTYASLAPGADWTVECFIRIPSPASEVGVWHLGNIASNNGRMSLWITAAGAIRFYIRRNDGTYWSSTTADGLITTNAWHHVAVVKSGTTISLYSGGTRRNTFDSGWTTNDLAINRANIGRARTDTGGIIYFNGWIDEFRYTPDAAIYSGTSYTVPSAAFADPYPASYGQSSAPTELTVEYANAGTPTANTLLTVTAKTGQPSAATRLSIFATGQSVASTALAVIGDIAAAVWRARCYLDGVNVSASLTGELRIEAEEGGARIAHVDILPPSGTLYPLDYVGRQILIDYVPVMDGVEVPLRLFTGLVDTPSYDPSTAILSLSCVDDLQNKVAALSIAEIDALVGGRYSAAVQGDIDEHWDYAQDRLKTVAASLDADAQGALRVTPWQGLTLMDTYTDDDLLYQYPSVAFPQASTFVNRVDIAYEYRYPRLRQRYTSVGWSGPVLDMDKNGYQYPTASEVKGAVGGSGWHTVLEIFDNAPTLIPHSTGGNVRTRSGAIDLAVFHLTQRHHQTVSETYALTVLAPESIEINGTLARPLSGALESKFEADVWENDYTMLPDLTFIGEQDFAPDAERADSDNAIQTLLDMARVMILGSHRSGRIGNAVVCNPYIDLDKRLAIDASSMQADGKVARVLHMLNIKAGSAITEFELAITGVAGAGIITPDTLEPPEPPEEAEATQNWQGEVAALGVSCFGLTAYEDSLMGLLVNPLQYYTVEDVPEDGTISYENPFYTEGSYPETGFRFRMPGVVDADREPVTKPVAAEYKIIIDEDPLAFIVP